MTSFPAWLLVIAGLIIVSLSLTAAYYLLKLKKQNNHHKNLQQEQQAALAEKRKDIVTDIRFIANAMQEGQCEITEGCIRIASLMKALDSQLCQQHEFSAIFSLYDNTRQLATHQAYKDLSAKERLRQYKIRLDLEDEYNTQVLQEIRVVINYPFNVD